MQKEEVSTVFLKRMQYGSSMNPYSDPSMHHIFLPILLIEEELKHELSFD